MTKIEAYNDFIYYLKAHFIRYCEDTFENTTRGLTMLYTGYANCPNMALESCMYFHSDCIECRIYYTELGSDIFKNSTHQADLYRLLNYINACVWPRVSDGFAGYRTPYLHTPRIYVTEDGYYDLTATSVIPYTFYEISPIITANYITACIPELMDKLSPFIFGVLAGNITTEDAIKYVKTNILKED